MARKCCSLGKTDLYACNTTLSGQLSVLELSNCNLMESWMLCTRCQRDCNTITPLTQTMRTPRALLQLRNRMATKLGAKVGKSLWSVLRIPNLRAGNTMFSLQMTSLAPIWPPLRCNRKATLSTISTLSCIHAPLAHNTMLSETQTTELLRLVCYNRMTQISRTERIQHLCGNNTNFFSREATGPSM
mmetsp:Transcript_66593/g.142431  ORF Transcript_66593/g.142431 Transcript_66593/m.142431 type:complete len:187 (-) Transcript_66593:101-661(-)